MYKRLERKKRTANCEVPRIDIIGEEIKRMIFEIRDNLEEEESKARNKSYERKALEARKRLSRTNMNSSSK